MGRLADLFVDIGTKTQGFDKGLDTTRAKLQDFAKQSNSLLSTIGLGIGGAGLVKFLSDATEKGSNLNETMSKIDQVFGKSAGTVTSMANQMAEQFGSVKGVTLDAAANLGLVAQGAGMSAQASADLSVKLTKLADDASSFYNVPLDVALEKIRSGMVGEAEPLRQFGVLLSEANMKAAALSLGLKPVNGEFTEQEKVMARVKIITEGLNKAQGDHARTMDGYANQVRKLKGEMENFQAAIGAAMAGAESQFIVNVEKKGIASAIGEHLRSLMPLQPGEAQSNAATKAGFGGETAFQNAADVAAGVAKGLAKQPPKPTEPPMEVQLFNMFSKMRTEQFETKKAQDMVGMSGLMANLGVFGMAGGQAGIAGAMNQMGMRDDLNQQIKEKKASMNAWGGGHVMDSESFMKQAQERILQPQDETAKKQLAELIKAREALDKLVGKQEGKAVGPHGVILRGRES